MPERWNATRRSTGPRIAPDGLPGEVRSDIPDRDQLWHLGRAATAALVGVVERPGTAADTGVGKDELDTLGCLVVAGDRGDDGADLLAAGEGEEGRRSAVG